MIIEINYPCLVLLEINEECNLRIISETEKLFIRSYKRRYFVFADSLADIQIRLREKGTILRSRADAIYHNYSSNKRTNTDLAANHHQFGLWEDHRPLQDCSLSKH